LRITGKTTNEEGAVLDVSLDADIETQIKVASFELHYSEDNGATYKKVSPDNDGRFIIPWAKKDYVKILNTGNVPLRYKTIGSNMTTGWENGLAWTTIGTGSYSNLLTISDWMNYFVVDTIGVAFDNGGIDTFVFRPNTSTVINNTDDSLQIRAE